MPFNNNADRSRNYGLRVGDFVRNSLGDVRTDVTGMVVYLGSWDNNSAWIQVGENEGPFEVTAEHCKILIKIEDALVILRDMA